MRLLVVLMLTGLRWAIAAHPVCPVTLELLGRPDHVNPTPAAFLSGHSRGGFLLAGEKLFYARPDKEPSLLPELKVAENPYSIPQLPNWTVTEVTGSPVISPFVKNLVGKFSVYDGIRCYSACFMRQGFASGAINASPNEFKLWATSPLVETVDGENILPGDVVAVGSGKSEVPVSHVATFETPNIIFQKASPLAEHPFELVTWPSFQVNYPRTSEPNRKFYRQKETLQDYIARHEKALPADLIASLRAIETTEKKMADYLLIRPPNKRTPEEEEIWAEEASSAIKKIRKEFSAKEDLAAAKLQSAKNAEEVFLWEVVKLRSQSLQSYPDPFD